MDGVRESKELRRAVARACRSFGAAASLEARVSPAIPVLFFGDLGAYAESHSTSCDHMFAYGRITGCRRTCTGSAASVRRNEEHGKEAERVGHPLR